MANWLTTREAVKRTGSINGDSQDAIIDRIIEAQSRQIDRVTRRFFIPRTETRLYRWPPILSFGRYSRSIVLWLDQDLLSVTTLQTKAQDASPTTIAATDYFTEPNNLGPPYDRIEIDQSSDAAWESGDTPQRSISVTGSWGYGNDTRSAGTVSSGLASDAAATSMVCSDSSLIGVGNTLLIGTEQIFVKDKINAALAAILIDGALTATQSQVTVTVDTGHGLVAGEVIMVGSERMYIEAVSTNDLTVVRAYDGSVLAAHANDTTVHVFRTLTIERGINGTTAAVHANAAAISVYEPPFDIVDWCVAEVLAAYAQHSAHWGRVAGTGEGAREFATRSLGGVRKDMIGRYQRLRMASI
uniref:Putative tail protein n=1 Tax=viral metagenome TaxID=1070528 RepID=A0A6M3XQC0_9ZZZZ